MAAEIDPVSGAAAVDAALAAWRQGDCVLGESWFVVRFSAAHPLSGPARLAAGEGVDLAEEQVRGLIVVSQTCDVVRSCVDRPYVEVSPLVEVDEARLQEIARGRRPMYALVPALVPNRLVADLDRTMTVEKPVIAGWIRTAGCTTDAEAWTLGQALARKRARFAFPDDFTDFTKKLQGRLIDKHERNSDEGRGLRALREIRVQVAPAWDAGEVELFFWFIRNPETADFEGKNWSDLLEQWLKLIPPTGRFTEINGQVATLEDLSAADYVSSYPLDLDHLSSRGSSG